jgi:hypothetical protein
MMLDGGVAITEKKVGPHVSTTGLSTAFMIIAWQREKFQYLEISWLLS